MVIWGRDCFHAASSMGHVCTREAPCGLSPLLFACLIATFTELNNSRSILNIRQYCFYDPILPLLPDCPPPTQNSCPFLFPLISSRELQPQCEKPNLYGGEFLTGRRPSGLGRVNAKLDVFLPQLA